MNPYLYKVDIFNMVDNIEEKDYGIVYADSYGEAAMRIEDYHGPELIAIEYLMRMDDSPITLTEQMFDTIRLY